MATYGIEGMVLLKTHRHTPEESFGENHHPQPQSSSGSMELFQIHLGLSESGSLHPSTASSNLSKKHQTVHTSTSQGLRHHHPSLKQYARYF
jgi:hypothetical protein